MNINVVMALVCLVLAAGEVYGGVPLHGVLGWITACSLWMGRYCRERDAAGGESK